MREGKPLEIKRRTWTETQAYTTVWHPEKLAGGLAWLGHSNVGAARQIKRPRGIS